MRRMSWCRGSDRGLGRRRSARLAAASKLSTMIMRPPQQGHGGRWSRPAPVAMSALSCSVDRSISATGAAISSLARAMVALQVALASNP